MEYRGSIKGGTVDTTVNMALAKIGHKAGCDKVLATSDYWDQN